MEVRRLSSSREDANPAWREKQRKPEDKITSKGDDEDDDGVLELNDDDIEVEELQESSFL